MPKTAIDPDDVYLIAGILRAYVAPPNVPVDDDDWSDPIAPHELVRDIIHLVLGKDHLNVCTLHGCPLCLS